MHPCIHTHTNTHTHAHTNTHARHTHTWTHMPIRRKLAPPRGAKCAFRSIRGTAAQTDRPTCENRSLKATALTEHGCPVSVITVLAVYGFLWSKQTSTTPALGPESQRAGARRDVTSARRLTSPSAHGSQRTRADHKEMSRSRPHEAMNLFDGLQSNEYLRRMGFVGIRLRRRLTPRRCSHVRPRVSGA